jgi:hypothetical protein
MPKTQGYTRIVAAQVPASEAARLQQLVLEHDRTLSAEIRRALRAHLERVDPKGTNP